VQSVDWRHSGLKDIVDTDETWRQDVLMRALSSTNFFAGYFLAESFTGPTTWQRRKNFETLDDDTLPFGYVCAYRGFAKTTQLWAKNIKDLCFRLQKFILKASYSLDYASTQTDNIRSALLSNPAIIEFFGHLKPQSYKGLNPAFSAKAWFVADPLTHEPFAFVCPKGSNQQVSGALVMLNGAMTRPTWIDIDDGEDREEVLNEELRSKYEAWYYDSLLQCVPDARPSSKTGRWAPSKDPLWRPPWRVWQQDTIKHEDSLMARIAQSPAEWVGHVFPQAEKREDDKLHTLVPEIVSSAQVRKEAASAEARGKLDNWYMEKMCLSQATDHDSWTRDLFKYYSDAALKLTDLPKNQKFVVVDPAKTAKTRSAPTAMLGVGISIEDRAIYFRDLVNARLGMDEMPHKAIDMCLALNTPILAVELTGAEGPFQHLFETAVMERGLQHWIEFHWLDARQSPRGKYGSGRDAIKRARGAALLPRYKQGEVYHEETLRESALEKQELSFPKPARWDALDCAGYVPELMRDIGIYWEPKLKAEHEMCGVDRLVARENRRWTEALETHAARSLRPLGNWPAAASRTAYPTREEALRIYG